MEWAIQHVLNSKYWIAEYSYNTDILDFTQFKIIYFYLMFKNLKFWTAINQLLQTWKYPQLHTFYSTFVKLWPLLQLFTRYVSFQKVIKDIYFQIIVYFFQISSGSIWINKIMEAIFKEIIVKYEILKLKNCIIYLEFFII